MKCIEGKSAPSVKDGVVQKQNNWDLTPNYCRAKMKMHPWKRSTFRFVALVIVGLVVWSALKWHFVWGVWRISDKTAFCPIVVFNWDGTFEGQAESGATVFSGEYHLIGVNQLDFKATYAYDASGNRYLMGSEQTNVDAEFVHEVWRVAFAPDGQSILCHREVFQGRKTSPSASAKTYYLNRESE